MSKSRNPGFQPGNPWLICDVCGFAYRQSEMKLRWDNAVVCQKDYEARHPQDFVRAVHEDQQIKGLSRPEPEDRFIEPGDVKPEDL